jgi:hypothetical protein
MGLAANLWCRRRDSTTSFHHFIATRLAAPMKIFALVVLSIVAGVVLLVGSSYIGVYFQLFEASLMIRPVTTVSVVLAVVLLLWLGPRHFRHNV